MKVQILRFPTQEDWNRAKLLALETEGKEAKTPASDEWKDKMLKCEHSPIRTLMFTIKLIDIPYWVSVHFVRHEFGVEHYVKSQRNDRQDDYDRNEAPQNAPVTHILDINAQELMYMARKRLCSKASEETRYLMLLIVEAVVRVCPEFGPYLVRQCIYLGKCPEIKSCGQYQPKMTTELTCNKYQKLAARTINNKLEPCQKEFHALHGMAGEVGELHSIYQKAYQGHETNIEQLKKELGDLMWFIAEYCTCLGWNLEDIAQMNIDKLKARYPEGFEEEKSLNRKEGDV